MSRLSDLVRQRQRSGLNRCMHTELDLMPSATRARLARSVQRVRIDTLTTPDRLIEDAFSCAGAIAVYEDPSLPWVGMKPVLRGGLVFAAFRPGQSVVVRGGVHGTYRIHDQARVPMVEALEWATSMEDGALISTEARDETRAVVVGLRWVR